MVEAEHWFESERLLYRPLQIEDTQALHRYNNEASRRRWFYFQEPDCLTLEYCRLEVEKSIAVCSRKINILEDHMDLGIVLKLTGEFIGSVGISGAERKNAVIGYSICEAQQGKGYATEAALAAVQWGFGQLGQLGEELRITGKVEHENWPSRRVLEKSGFTLVRAEQYVSVYERKEGNSAPVKP